MLRAANVHREQLGGVLDVQLLPELLRQILDELGLAASWDAVEQEVHSRPVASRLARVVLGLQEIAAHLDDALRADARLDVQSFQRIVARRFQAFVAGLADAKQGAMGAQEH